MIYCLSGKILKKNPDSAVISCGGVGYWVQIPSSASGALPPVGGEATLYTVLSVSENDISLYGFASEEQQACFKMLTGVSGVGPKAGLAILSVLTPDRIALAISSGDHKAFTAANGVGPKLAQRITLELKDKVGMGLAGSAELGQVSAAAQSAGGVAQAIGALVSLGYSQSEAAQAVARLDASLPVEELIRLALRGIAQGKR